MKKINTDKAPKPVGPYSQAIVANGFIFLAGQIPLDPATGLVVLGGIEAQTRQVFANIQAVLQEAGSGLEKIVKATVFLKDLNDFAVMNEVYAGVLGDVCPARSAIEVSRIPKDCLVEIEVIALEA